LKNRIIRFLSTDIGTIVSLGAMILLLGFGGVILSRAVAANMLRSDARLTSDVWAATLTENADIPAIIAGSIPSDKIKNLLENATQVGDLYRIRIWSKTGLLIFSYERGKSATEQTTTLAERRGQQMIDSVLSGSTFTEEHVGNSAQDPPYFAESYVPIKRDGNVVGILEIYLDQTFDRAAYHRSFLSTGGIIAFTVLLAGGLPGFMVYRKMLAHRIAQAEALFLAGHDSLTGIANRKMLGEAAKNALALSRRNKSWVAALLIDLDRFKDINDSFGHGTGDEVLRTFAMRLNSSIRIEDMAARLGGDEFVILQVGMTQPDGAISLADRIMEILSQPYSIGVLELSCGASIGVAIGPTDAEEWDPLLSCADAALYKAKAEGSNTIRFFEPGMDAIFHERRRLEIDLRCALMTRAFQLAYQPLFCFRDGSLLGFEALLRWPEGWVPQSPATFIPVAEDSGLIVPIGTWVLESACKTAATWTKPLKIAINLSPVQFRHGEIVAIVEKALNASGLDPTRLELEVTESLWLQDTDAVFDQLTRLRTMGVSIALDDFGTGYSSLTYLWKFPFDTVKIDRSFVTAMDLDPKAGAIVKTIVSLGRTLDLTITAEGVETPAQARALHEAGCDQAQGYLFGRPLSASSASELIDADPASAAGYLQ
jgi:diguanylate cyclase (GGDEF)-like protein